MKNYNQVVMCLPHYHSASIFQVIDKIEHAVNTTITEYYGQADKNKFTEAVDRAQQEVRGRVLITFAVEKKSKNYSSLRKMLFQSLLATRDETMTFWLLVPMLYQLSYKRLVGTKHAAYS